MVIEGGQGQSIEPPRRALRNALRLQIREDAGVLEPPRAELRLGADGIEPLGFNPRAGGEKRQQGGQASHDATVGSSTYGGVKGR